MAVVALQRQREWVQNRHPLLTSSSVVALESDRLWPLVQGQTEARHGHGDNPDSGRLRFATKIVAITSEHDCGGSEYERCQQVKRQFQRGE